jgi:hypothetical protein
MGNITQMGHAIHDPSPYPFFMIKVNQSEGLCGSII